MKLCEYCVLCVKLCEHCVLQKTSLVVVQALEAQIPFLDVSVLGFLPF